MRTAALFFALVVGLLASPSNSQELIRDGNDFLLECQREYFDIYCLGFVMGSIKTFDSYVEVLEIDPYFCLPAGNTSQQLYDAVTQYLEDRPGVRHYEITSSILTAMNIYFPCAD